MPTPTVRTDRFTLRPFTESDADSLIALMTDATVLRYWDSPPWGEHEQHDRVARFLASSRRMAEDGTGARWVIEETDGARFLGWITLQRYDAGHRSASLGYCLAEAAWGRGVATEAARAVLGWAFDALDLNRVQAEADTRNPASARVLEKCGFQHEGTLREDCVVDGVASDSWVYGLLEREWRAAAGGGAG